MEKIEKVYVVASRTMDQIGGLIILPAIFFVVIVDVVLRYVFNSPFVWSLEFNEWMLLLLFMLAIPECTRQNGHVRMELIVANLPPRMQSFFDGVYAFCAIAIFSMLARHSWGEFLFDYQLGRATEYLQLPLWFRHFLIFTVCVLLIIYYVLRLVANIRGLKEFSRSESTRIEE